MASRALEVKNLNYARNLKRVKQFPSVVVGAEFSYFKKVDKSGPICPLTVTKKLRARLLTIGNLYTEANGNTIGCCAEVNAANQVLIKRPFIHLNQITFSRALRPRTMQEIPVCRNCRITFN